MTDFDYHAIHVIHVGPIEGPPNGMQTVIRMLSDQNLGCDSSEMLPTWEIGRGFRRRLKPALGSALKLLRRDLRGTVVHIHVAHRGSMFRKGIVFAAAKIRRAAVVITPHSNQFVEFAGRHPKMFRIVFYGVDAVTCLTAQHLEVMIRLPARAQVNLVPNPVGISDEYTSSAGESGPTILFIGAVSLGKGADVLAEAWPMVRAEIRDAVCIVVGPIIDFEMPIHSGVQALGSVANNEIAPLINEARAVCLPSRSEVLPMVLLEGMAAGRPIVATPVGGTPELTDAGGISVPVGDASALAASLVRLLRDGELATRLGNRGRQLVETKFTAARVDALLRSTYKGALEVSNTAK